jgi:hypothetical protein
MFSIEDMVGDSGEGVRGSVKRVKEERVVSWRRKCCCTGTNREGKGNNEMAGQALASD